MAQRENDFTLTAQDTLEAVFAEQEKVAAEAERTVHEIGDLEHRVPVPKDAPGYPRDLDEWSLRWVLLHLVEEIARHPGHADIIREHVDGATTFPLMAAAEGWPATGFLRPWQPPEKSTA